MAATVRDPEDEMALHVVAAAIFYGRRLADQAVRGMNALGIDTNSIAVWPREFLFELGGIVQLADWERAGFRDSLPADLPEATTALLSLLERARQCLESFSHDRRGSELVGRLLRVRFQFFWWEASLTLGVDIIRCGYWDEQLFDAIADFVWRNLHVEFLVGEVSDDPIEE